MEQGKRKSWAAAVACVALLLPAVARGESIAWEVVDRFRLLKEPEHASVLHRQILVAPARVAAGRSYTYPSPLSPLSSQYNQLALPATAWHPGRQRYEPGYARVASWSVRASLGAKARGDCSWSVASSGFRVDAPCSGVTLDGVLQKDEISATRKDGDRPAIVQPVEIAHRTIVVLGDSFTAGEGVPDINRFGRPAEDRPGEVYDPTEMAYWWDQRCHRSLLAAPVQASLKWAMGGANRSVTTLSYACSGAVIGDFASTNFDKGGLLGKYFGRETRDQLSARRTQGGYGGENVNLHYSDIGELPSQLNQAVRDLCSSSGEALDANLDTSAPIWRCRVPIASPDLLIFNVGGNDVGFGQIITQALFGDCGKKCLERITGTGFSSLDEHYRALAQSIRDNLAPKRVLMLDYGNPTQTEDGKYCRHDGSPFFAKSVAQTRLLSVSADEYRLIHRSVVKPLNEAGARLVRANASNDWHHLRVMEKATALKGICSKKSWFTSGWASYAKQHNLPGGVFSSGTAHPNLIYQSYQADAIVDWMQRNRF